jgi:hypothetical protein
MKAIWLAAVLLFAVPVLGQNQLVNSAIEDPTPKVSSDSPTPKFWDNINKMEFSTMTSLAAFDMAQTCHNLASRHTVHALGLTPGVTVPMIIGGHEDFLPTQSCTGAVGLTAAFDASALGLSYLFHRTHHHKLERIPMLLMGEESARGIIYSRLHDATVPGRIRNQ